MPEMHFRIRWPDGRREACYSPSLVIKDYFAPGQSYALPDFVAKSRDALTVASERGESPLRLSLFACPGASSDGSRRKPKARIPPARSSSRPSRNETMSTPHFPVVVIGGGQAGLSVSHQLKRHGLEHLVVEKHRVGHAWRSERWDSFCLVTPNWQCRLPDFPYAGAEPDGFMVKDDIVRYVEAFAATVKPPIRGGRRRDEAVGVRPTACSRSRRPRAA